MVSFLSNRQKSVRHVVLLVGAVCMVSASLASAQDLSQQTIAAIKEEGLQRSQVMDLVGWLSDVYGPRLTGSPAIEEARVWVMERLRQWNLANVHDERFAFGKGWSLERFYAHMTEPQVMPIIGYPKAWTSSTQGTVEAEVIRVDIRTKQDLDRYRGALRGRIVLPQAAREVRMLEGNLVLRMDDALLAEAQQMLPESKNLTRQTASEQGLADLVTDFYFQEGVVAVLDRGSDLFMVNGAPAGSRLAWPTQRADGGTIFVGRGGSWRGHADNVVPSATIAVEHYNRMVRILEKGLPVFAEINIRTRFHDEDERLNGFNIIGEIPGTDLRDEVVILGAHLDSTHAATGATDNASGTAAMMEALRILKMVDAKPRRTIRIALWGAEEQGLLGSRSYVRKHFGDPGTMDLKPGHETLSAYFNLDNGAGRIRGIWLQDNVEVAAIFEPWVDALKDLEVSTLGLRSPNGTDHVSFDEVGLPGFLFMQDRLEYNSRTHHSNMDFFDRVQHEDMMQMAVVAAVFAYNTAMLDDRLPRKTFSGRR
jgi:carboxypeptidase Q